MAKIDSGFLDIGYMDSLSRQKTAVHKLDPRVKLLTTMVFIIMVVSNGKYELSALLPFIVYPVFLCTVGNIPLIYLLKKILIVSPFALMIGIFNPLLDQNVLQVFGGVQISAGWISFFSILVRFFLTVSAAFCLIAVTGFNSVCMAMENLGVPQVFTVQLMFLHRYLFVLTSEASRMIRASYLRRPDRNAIHLKTFGSLLGHLLLRTLDRAQRIHLAMHCRGFDGHIRTLRQSHIGLADILFLLIWSGIFIFLRFNNITQIIGKLAITLFT